jgi:hypothetical protein
MGGDQEDCSWEASPGRKLARPHLNKWTPVILAIYQNKMILVQAVPGIKQDPISKITNANIDGGVSQVVEHLLSQMQGPEFNP